MKTTRTHDRALLLACLPALLAVSVLCALALAAPAGAMTGGLSPTTGEGAGEAVTEAPAEAGISFSNWHLAGVTWYGPGLYGRHTACGQTLRRSTLGVAHRSLPCGTPVKFFFHGREIVTTVIDRGPYSKGNSWDLTSASAEALGFSSTGRAQLHYAVAVGSTRP